MSAATPPAKEERKPYRVIPLLGIAGVEDRSFKPQLWTQPSGFDVSGLFGTYKYEKVLYCRESVHTAASVWADAHGIAAALVDDSQEHRLVIHWRVPVDNGDFMLVYRLFTRPENHHVTTLDFLDESARIVPTALVAKDLRERYGLQELERALWRALACAHLFDSGRKGGN